MTIKEIQERVGHIRNSKEDYEYAHGEEDVLYHDFVKHVAKANVSDLYKLGKMAQEILKTKRIRFARHCA